MTKFKPGDVVRRTGHGITSNYRGMHIGDVDTVIEATGSLHLANFGGGHDPAYFELVFNYRLPDAPTDVLYIDQYTAVTGQSIAARDGAGVRVRLDPYGYPLISVQVGAAGLQTRLDADSALQLCHDLRRMAMELKRREKLND